MKNIRKILVFAIMATMTPAFANLARAGEIWIVSSANSPLKAVTSQVLKNAYLGKPARSESGDMITAIDRKDAPNEIRPHLYEEVIGKSPTQIKAYWSQMIFTGLGYPPTRAEDLAALKKMLSNDTTAVTFIDPSENDPAFKVLLKVTTH